MAEIALVTGSLPPEVCGVGDYTYRLHEQLGKLLDVDLVHIPIKRTYQPNLYRMFDGRQLVHLQYPTEGWGNSVLPSFLGFTKGRSKLVLTLHEWSQMNPLRRASIRPLVARADAFIFVSNLERDAFLATCPPGCRAKPMEVIPIGVNLQIPTLRRELIQDARQRELALGFDLLLTHFGFVHPSKQPEKLLETCAALKTRGHNPKLLFVGGFQKDKADDQQALKSQAEQLGLKENVVLKGFLAGEEAAYLIAAGDANIGLYADGLTPRRGSFWFATQLGCPVITTEPAAGAEFPCELVSEHIRFVSPNADAHRIVDLIENQPRYEPLRYPPLDVPAWSDIALAHERLYGKLLGKRGGSIPAPTNVATGSVVTPTKVIPYKLVR